MQSAMFHTIVRLATMPEKTSSRNVSPVGQNYSPRMKFNSQTTPLTTFSLLLTTCHVAQIPTFRLVAPMAAPTNLRIGTEHKKWDWGAFHKRKEKGYHSNSEGLFLACVSCLDFILQYKMAKNRDTLSIFAIF